MLHYLKIENLALMDASELELGTGFTAVTGETGAGKSVLLGALNLLAGNRAEKTIIRQGQQQCRVEAMLHFTQPARVNAILDAIGLPPCEEGQLILARSLHKTKPPRIHINGAVSTLSSLRELGEAWIDFHGPGEPQKLFAEKHQLGMLDQYAGNTNDLEDYAALYSDWRHYLAEIDSVRKAEKLSDDEAEFIRTQLETIDSVSPTEDSIASLERDYARIDKAQELATLTQELKDGLAGEQGLSSQAGSLLRDAQELAGIDSSALELQNRLEALIIELEDLAAEYAQLGHHADMDEETAAEVQERMSQWLSLKRKYGPTPKDVEAKRQALMHRLNTQSDVESILEKLRKKVAEQEASLRTKADKLRKRREKTSKILANKVTNLLTRLGFQQAGFAIEIYGVDSLGPTGDSGCHFLFAPNAGQELLPLNKIASSGETARVMLALKAVLAAADATPLLVFDEVDANVGGEIGAEVGRELSELADAHQVLCVTHLPQVAAYGLQHLMVEKKQSKSTTRIRITALHEDTQARESEIARMLGDRQSESALKHARELLGQK